MKKADLEVLNPIAITEVEQVTVVPPVDTLEGKKILLVYNGKLNSNIAVERIGDLLQERFTGLERKSIFYPTPLRFTKEQIAEETNGVLGTVGTTSDTIMGKGAGG